jgi:hypothetical protein
LRFCFASFLFIVFLPPYIHCEKRAEISSNFFWQSRLKFAECPFPPPIFACKVRQFQGLVEFLLKLPVILNVPVMRRLLMLHWLIETKEEIDDQLTLRVQKVVGIVTFH